MGWRKAVKHTIELVRGRTLRTDRAVCQSNLYGLLIAGNWESLCLPRKDQQR
jgi:hypothetical protein